MPEEDLVDIKFRLYDGSDIGPFRYSSASTVEMLKERIVSEWPKGKSVIPKVANEIKLISFGKILENNRTVGQCQAPFGELAGGVMVMHVVVQPSQAKTKTGMPDGSGSRAREEDVPMENVLRIEAPPEHDDLATRMGRVETHMQSLRTWSGEFEQAARAHWAQQEAYRQAQEAHWAQLAQWQQAQQAQWAQQLQWQQAQEAHWAQQAAQWGNPNPPPPPPEDDE